MRIDTPKSREWSRALLWKLKRYEYYKCKDKIAQP